MSELLNKKTIPFKDLKKEVKKVGFLELRREADDYLEAVVSKKKLTDLTHRLESFFGQAAFPSQATLDVRAMEIVNAFGGLRSDQTLYFSSDNQQAVFVMLWPWQAEENLTLKMGQK
jgi:hypothetical protein